MISRSNLDHLQNVWQQLAVLKIPVWLRYVLIPGWTDQPDALDTLKAMIKELPTLEKVEILPYNSLAETKWQKLGWDSPLFHDPVKVTEEQVRAAEERLGIVRRA
jgi:pyruvate formate lyase activating enzyme